jgi:uroporphyrin-III C-methyltransferase/precorrin-2 dehydrogenase/sirohydrochlorin ferrochelatase
MTVYLVGAGPGDPELLTVRATRLLALADVVVVDRLVPAAVRALIAPGSRTVDVGKRPGSGDPDAAQHAINELLIEHGRTGATVVRLKGGDPFVFGRGGEELIALRHAGVPVEVVPGISSALGLPALAQVPVTHRDLASQVLIASGHDAAAAVAACSSLPPGATIVLLMAVETRGVIAKGLLASGRDPSTPVAVVERGATPRERRVITTLEGLGSIELDAPAVVVIGAVAELIEAAVQH